MERLLLAGDLQLAQRAEDGHAAAADADTPGQLLKRGVGLLPHQLAETFLAGVVQRRRMSPAVGPGFQRSALAAELQQAGDKGRTDAEASGDLPLRALLVIDGGGDALTEVQ
jgi:hypothetical protein